MDGTEQVFDRALYTARLRKAQGSEPNILTRTIAEELAERLDVVARRLRHISAIPRRKQVQQPPRD